MLFPLSVSLTVLSMTISFSNSFVRWSKYRLLRFDLKIILRYALNLHAWNARTFHRNYDNDI